MSESLGKATLELDANLARFVENVKTAEKTSGGLENSLDALVAIAKLVERELNRIKIHTGNAVESQATARQILDGVKGVSREAVDAADNLDKVKLDERNAAETAAAGAQMQHSLEGVKEEANQARHALDRLKLTGRTGVGVGPFGSGFGRMGLLGSAIAGGVLTAPAAGPGVAGLAAALPAFGAGAAGMVGTLVLALQGVGKAISGDKKAYDELMPAQQQFVLQVRSLTGWLDKLKQTAAGNMFPGLTDALHSALSPGTMAAITRGVQQFASAIGNAGRAWGQYFGSAQFQQIFGPLMQSGARNLGVLSDAILHLFDALGVIGRAAIPFTNWLNDAIDKGARFASSWVRAKEATGELGHAMTEAQSSLRLVGGLVEALLKAVGALGVALYPVSKVAVQNLTDGLNALAGIITRNQQTIRELVGGALGALVTAVKAAAGVIGALWPVIERVASALGGWKSTFELLIGLKIASVVNGWAASFAKLAGAEALGGATAASGGLLANLTKLKLLGPIAIAVAIEESISKKLFPGITPDVVRPGNPYPVGSPAFDAFRAGLTGTKPLHATIAAVRNTPEYKAGVAARKAQTGGGQYSPLYGDDLKAYISSAAARYGLDPQAVLAVAHAEGGFQGAIGDSGTSFGPFQLHRGGALPKGQGAGFAQSASGIDYALRKMAASGASGLTGMDAVRAIVTRFERPADGGAGDLKRASGYLAGLGITDGSTSPWGPVPDWTKNVVGPKPPLIPMSVTNMLNRASVNASKAKQLGNVGGTAKRYLDNELADLKSAQAALKKVKPGTAREKQQVAAKTTEIANKIRDVQSLTKHAALATGCKLIPLPRRKTSPATPTPAPVHEPVAA